MEELEYGPTQIKYKILCKFEYDPKAKYDCEYKEFVEKAVYYFCFDPFLANFVFLLEYGGEYYNCNYLPDTDRFNKKHPDIYQDIYWTFGVQSKALTHFYHPLEVDFVNKPLFKDLDKLIESLQEISSEMKIEAIL